MKQSLTVEIEVPEGWRLVAYRYPKRGENTLRWEYPKIAEPTEVKVVEYGWDAPYPCFVVEKITDLPKYGEVWRHKPTGVCSLALHAVDIFQRAWLNFGGPGGYFTLQPKGTGSWPEACQDWEKVADSYSEWIKQLK